jgi:hypothetical protein
MLKPLKNRHFLTENAPENRLNSVVRQRPNPSSILASSRFPATDNPKIKNHYNANILPTPLQHPANTPPTSCQHLINTPGAPTLVGK